MWWQSNSEEEDYDDDGRHTSWLIPNIRVRVVTRKLGSQGRGVVVDVTRGPCATLHLLMFVVAFLFVLLLLFFDILACPFSFFGFCCFCFFSFVSCPFFPFLFSMVFFYNFLSIRIAKKTKNNG